MEPTDWNLVDPGRFGALLNATRSSLGLGLSAMSRQCGLRPDQLAGAESGSEDLGPDSIVHLAEAYGLVGHRVGWADLRPVSDRTSASNAVGASDRQRPEVTLSSDGLLARMAVLFAVFLGDDHEPVRDPFIVDWLVGLTGMGGAEVASGLMAAQRCPEIGAEVAVLSEQIAVPAAGLAVGSTVFGTAVLVAKRGTARSRPSAPAAGPLRVVTDTAPRGAHI